MRMGTGGAAVAVTLLMVLSPMAAAASHTFKPPYAKTATALYTQLAFGGCGTASQTVPVNWSATTGVMIASGKTSTKSCTNQVGGVGGSSYGEYVAEALIGMPIKVTTTALHSVNVSWNVHATTSSSFTAGTCYLGSTSSSFFYCESIALWEVFGQASVVDNTNGSVFYSSNSFFAYNESYNQTFWFGSWSNSSGVFGFGAFGAQTLFINASLVAGHSYSVVTYIEVIAESALEAYNAAVKGGSASASVNMGSGTNKATLTSIVVN